MTTKPRILVSDGDTVFGIGLRVLLKDQPELDIISGPDNADELMTMIVMTRPELIIMDLQLQDDINTPDIATIKDRYPQTRVLLVTQHKSEQAIRAALAAGASGYVLKDASNTELLIAVRSVLNGKVYLSPSLSDNIINAFLLGSKSTDAKAHLNTLTKREREILKLVAEGHTNRYVASQLRLSIKTVEKHRSNLMKKLDLHNVSALTTFAIGQGLISQPE